MKLNREQIIKALECCTNCICNHAETDTECPLVKMSFCKNYLMKQSLSLINELTEENERLRDTAYRLECEVHRERANTVRKMQEMLKKCFNNEMEHAAIYTEGQVLFAIDQIAKEMLEGIE